MGGVIFRSRLHTDQSTSGVVSAASENDSVDRNGERQRVTVGPADKVFEDYASGSSRDRPELTALLGYIRDGDQVRVASMDRLARSVIDLSQLTDEILSKGASLHFANEALAYFPGQTDAYAEFQLHLLGTVAQLERSLIRERQAEGIAIAKAAGKCLGRKLRSHGGSVTHAPRSIAAASSEGPY